MCNYFIIIIYHTQNNKLLVLSRFPLALSLPYLRSIDADTVNQWYLVSARYLNFSKPQDYINDIIEHSCQLINLVGSGINHHTNGIIKYNTSF